MDENTLPNCNLNDHASVESWFGPFGYADHYRKVVLSGCREAVRAKYAVKEQKISESRIDDLARTHPNYLGFLADSLEGRTVRERNARERMGL